MTSADLLRRIPQVDAVLRDASLGEALERFGPVVAARLARDEIAAVRAAAERGVEPPAASAVAASAAAKASALHASRLRRVINATGVVLHTNLGRAPLSAGAIAAVADAAGATPLEFDVSSGERGRRAPLASFLAAALTGAEAAHVVNNNAAALLLALSALARGREVIVGRGEMIEIGGEFRLPSILEASGAQLCEVGTTNRTHARDYRGAIGPQTAMILLVHPSNYRVVGFTANPSLGDVAAIAREAGVPLVYDTGSGLLAPHETMPDEPDAASALRDGADLVCFSGDKLLGGPQAGILAGRASLVDACRRHPIARAVRADKLTLAALEATLAEHARGEASPVHRMLAASPASLRARAERIAGAVPDASVEEGGSVPGGGSAPGHEIPTAVVAVRCADPDAMLGRLRAGDPPVVARIDAGRVLLDLRTVADSDDHLVQAALRRCAG